MLLSNTPVVPNSINRQAQAQFPSPSVALRLRVESKLSHGLYSFGDTNFWGSGRGYAALTVNRAVICRLL